MFGPVKSWIERVLIAEIKTSNLPVINWILNSKTLIALERVSDHWIVTLQLTVAVALVLIMVDLDAVLKSEGALFSNRTLESALPFFL